MSSLNYELLGLSVGTGFSFGLIAYILKEKEVISLLKDIVEVEIDSALAADVASSTDGIAACAWGCVKALGKPLKCLQRPEVNGVVWEHTIQEHLVTESKSFGFWVNDKRIVNETLESIPFAIQNKEIGFQILIPSSLQHVDLHVVSMNFVAASNSFASHLWGFFKGVRPTGMEQTERMLLEGTRVMGIGKLVAQDGSFLLKPCHPLPYMVTTKTKQAVGEDLESALLPAKFFLILALGGSCYCLYRIGKRIYKRYKDEIYRRREQAYIRAARQNREDSPSDIPDSLMCIICSCLRDAIFLPCKHVCMCRECALGQSIRKCPVCRSPIEDVAHVFFS